MSPIPFQLIMTWLVHLLVMDDASITRMPVFYAGRACPSAEQQRQPSAAAGAAYTGVHWRGAVSGLEAVQPPTAPMAVGHTA
jgi:hypothetical protein